MSKVWVMSKVLCSCGGEVDVHLFAFSSFKAANRAMYEDWCLEYDENPDARLGDAFWDSQVDPFERDSVASMRSKDMSHIEWRIQGCEIEDGTEDD